MIRPVIDAGGIVVSDRYHLSTYAYQQTQGVELSDLIKIHKERRIENPDLTVLIEVDYKTASERMKKRGEAIEKFEGDREFIEKLIKNYKDLYINGGDYPSLFGPIVLVKVGRVLMVLRGIFKKL